MRCLRILDKPMVLFTWDDDYERWALFCIMFGAIGHLHSKGIR